MFALSIRFSIESYKFDGQILACVILIWITVVACTISSIFNRTKHPTTRALWIALVLLLPLLGVLIYLPFAFEKESIPQFLLGPPKKRGGFGSKGTPGRQG